MSRKSTAGVRWTKEQAAREFGINPRTLSARFRKADIQPAGDGCWSTAQVCAAVYGDIDGEKLRLIREQADKLELENQQTRRDLIPIGPLAETLNRALGAIKAKIQGSTQLAQKDRDDICAICERAYRAAFAGEPGPGVVDSPGKVSGGPEQGCPAAKAP